MPAALRQSLGFLWYGDVSPVEHVYDGFACRDGGGGGVVFVKLARLASRS